MIHSGNLNMSQLGQTKLSTFLCQNSDDVNFIPFLGIAVKPSSFMGKKKGNIIL